MPPDTGSDNGNWIKRMTPLAIRNLAQRGSIPLFLEVDLPLFLLNGISRQPSDNGKRVGFNLHCFIRHSTLYSYFEDKKCLYIDRSLIKSWRRLIWLFNKRIGICRYVFAYSYADSVDVNIVYRSVFWWYYEYCYGCYGVLSKNSYSAKLPAISPYQERM